MTSSLKVKLASDGPHQTTYHTNYESTDSYTLLYTWSLSHVFFQERVVTRRIYQDLFLLINNKSSTWEAASLDHVPYEQKLLFYCSISIIPIYNGYTNSLPQYFIKKAGGGNGDWRL